jgi:polysaccharide pyruvyl transferase WcaK-like protein
VSADGAVRHTEVADLAFLTRRDGLPADLTAWLSARRSEGRRIVLLNSNGLLETKVGTVGAYRDLISQLGDEVAFIAVPHASRGVPSDVELALDLGRQVRASNRLHVLDFLLAPGQIAELAAHSELVVTGRMHLAILAASVGTPALTLSYQGKVAGLYELLGTDSWLDSDARAPDRLPFLVRTTLARAPELRTAIRAALPRLIRLAHRNLPGPQTPADGDGFAR